jgi:hypothetical protein
MIDYPLILSINYSNDSWSILSNDYETLEWFSETPKPTQEELDALWSSTDESQSKNTCKAQATTILNDTDWTSIPDVGNPDASNPYLVNQSAFIAYRSQIRALAVNPVVDPVWPTQPIEQWSS